MPPYGQAAYDALNGLRSQNPPANPFRAPQSSSGNRPLPPGLSAPSIAFKPSPFYEMKYQVGDVKTLDGA
jgi:E3 SUMO-protein ligase PIAS1